MNKQEAIELLNSEGWTKADAKRALELIDFKTNPDVDEIIIRRAASKFAGFELIHRQNLQRAQKAVVTKRNNEIKTYLAQIEQLAAVEGQNNQQEIEELKNKITQLIEVNDILKKDNRNLKNIVDEIRLKLTIEFKHMLKLENSQIKEAMVKLLKSTLG